MREGINTERGFEKQRKRVFGDITFDSVFGPLPGGYDRLKARELNLHVPTDNHMQQDRNPVLN